MLELYFFNVGHGDSIAIKFPNNKWGVIDCNLCDGQKIPNVLKFLTKNKVKHLKFICITHPHIDHFLGIEKIVEHYNEEIDDFILFDNGQNTVFERQTSSLTKAIKSFIGFKKHKIILASQNKKYLIDDFKINLLNPNSEISEELFGKYFEDRQLHILNKLSVVMHFEYNSCNILLNADVPTKECRNFLINNDIKANIIKISHHGSLNNNPKNLLLTMSKTGCTAIISSDGNGKYKSVPHKNVLKWLDEDLQSKILKTYELPQMQSDNSDTEAHDSIDSVSEILHDTITDGYFKIIVNKKGKIFAQTHNNI